MDHAPVKIGHHTLKADIPEEYIKNKIPIEMKAGSSLLFTGRTLHYTGPNISNIDRKA
jgi:ectoine hydroxylase-related dioxygenase (phytanoyl-CoA dioxygenase family)